MRKLNDQRPLCIVERDGCSALHYTDIVYPRQQIEVFKRIAGLCRPQLVRFECAFTYHLFDLIAAVWTVPAGAFVKGALAEEDAEILFLCFLRGKGHAK